MNISNAKEAIEVASKKRADLIVFPEMSFTGFSMNIDRTGEAKHETIEVMMQMSEKYQINIGFGWVKLVTFSEAIKGENHYTMVSPKKEILLDYVKCHPFSYAKEDKYFVSGNHISFCKIDDFIVSVAICYDLRFPELFQMESKAAQMILVPANWPEARRDHWRALLKARAIENQCYIVGVNCTGRMQEQTYVGDSCIINPNGEVLLEMSAEHELGIYEIINNVAWYQDNFPTKSDRRESIYQYLSMKDHL